MYFLILLCNFNSKLYFFSSNSVDNPELGIVITSSADIVVLIYDMMSPLAVILASKAFIALMFKKLGFVAGSTSSNTLLPMEIKNPLSSFQPSDTPASKIKSCANSDAVLFFRTNGLELARFLTLSTSFAFAFKKKKNDRRKT